MPGEPVSRGQSIQPSPSKCQAASEHRCSRACGARDGPRASCSASTPRRGASPHGSGEGWEASQCFPRTCPSSPPPDPRGRRRPRAVRRGGERYGPAVDGSATAHRPARNPREGASQGSDSRPDPYCAHLIHPLGPPWTACPTVTLVVGRHPEVSSQGAVGGVVPGSLDGGRRVGSRASKDWLRPGRWPVSRPAGACGVRASTRPTRMPVEGRGRGRDAGEPAPRLVNPIRRGDDRRRRCREREDAARELDHRHLDGYPGSRGRALRRRSSRPGPPRGPIRSSSSGSGSRRRRT